ncbi:hypothetical protein M3Y94_01035600 [Aphelenchoides besseyi]|nr:hypothetical protein M3Y94_01035600 [Aphelenchoides besseyi]KAI6223954.1 hypothetical protein M3Y95_00831500 [Aphelenchoides besseyi]
MSKEMPKRTSSKESSSQSNKRRSRSAPRRPSREVFTARPKLLSTNTPRKASNNAKPPTQLAEKQPLEPSTDDKAQPIDQTTNQQPANGRELRGKQAPPHLPNGIVLLDRLRIDRMLGSGGFGQVFRAFDQATGKWVAVKVEPCDRDAGRMILEQKVLSLLRSTDHFPKLIASGQHANFMFIAMEMLGRNLGDLRRRLTNKRFCASTGLRAVDQMVAALREVHNVGYIHRDVKPANMCIGLGQEKQRTIYLVDFGMTRRHRTESGEVRKCRTYAGFRGTSRYVSLTVHERRDQGPRDDLWSLLYSLIELVEGSLPWRHIDDDYEMEQKKRRTPIEEMLMHLPRSIKEIAEHLEQLTYEQTPNYELISQILVNALPSNPSEQPPFEWESMNVSTKSFEMESASIH